MLAASVYSYRPSTQLPSLSVVMPAHNEADNIEAAVDNALEAASRVAARFEVVVVDDGSTDGTPEIVESLAAVYGDAVRLVRNDSNLGYGPTVRRAWSVARMEWLLFSDSDRQFDLREVGGLVPLTDDATIVAGWRKHRQDPVLRRVNSRIFNVATRLFFGTRLRDIDCAFKLMRTSALRQLELTANSAMVNAELIYQARQHGLPVAQVPVTHYARKFGKASGGDPKVIARAIGEFFAMRRRFNRPEARQLRLHCWLVALLALVGGVAATSWAVVNHVVLAYGDAEAHLNISKRVVSGLTHGLAQLGGVWLPLPHMLMLPFVINDAMWRAGIAGAAVGVPALILLAVMSFRLAHLLTGSIMASWLAPVTVLANANALYLAATPMTEVLLLAMVTTSVCFLARWVLQDGLNDLVLAGLFGALATLSRYDGWALVCCEAAVVMIMALLRHRTGRSMEGLMILFGVLAFSGIAGWILWNQLIFSNPLYFAGSVYGSAEQQRFFLQHGLLPTYHDLGKSVAYWLEDVRLVAGSILSGVAGAGLVTLLFISARRRRVEPILVAAAALSSFAFYILSLYVGQASLILPRFVPHNSPYQLSNVRYGLQALLPIGLFIAYLAARRPKILVPLLLLLVLEQGVASVVTQQVIAYEDGTQGLSSQLVSKGPDGPRVEDWMRRNYVGGLVLMDDYRRPIGPVESGVPMQNFIGVGNKPYWKESLDNPGLYATWIILQQSATDAVWSGFNTGARSILEDHFVEVYRSGYIHVYKERAEPVDLVVKRGQHLYVNGQRWVSVGVNSYDLLDQSQQVIDGRLAQLANGGHNTVRIWCFDKDGGIGEATLDKLGVTLRSARDRGLRVICTLGNALSDYGGQEYFTPGGQNFFTSEVARARYRDQVRRVLKHRDAYGVRLADNPAILAWDLLNEPRNNSGIPQGSVTGWTEEMGRFVSSIDQRHLVTVGGEGFQSGYPANTQLSGTQGTDFPALCGLSSITLCSAHLFPKYLSPSADSKEIGQVMQGWRSQADQLNKPVLVEEVGYSLSDDGNLTRRHAFYDNVARATNNSDLDGALLWNLGARADKAFTLAYNDLDSVRVLSAWSSIVRKTR
ncbi:MAG: glycosyltransferase [Candidatus Dormibacteraeota bacterium]|nr:glycosyltransferase [Candidatus Dormibacteraeota bacterium]